MLDISLIENTIQELEGKETTFANCEKLSHLYACRDNLARQIEADVVEQELDDILPYYTKYREVKRKYQLHQSIDHEVIQSMSNVCRELKEFISLLYSSTEMHKERVLIKEMLQELNNQYPA